MIEMDIWDIPTPSLNSRNSCVGYDMRQVWYTLLCIEIWPTTSMDISDLSGQLGYFLHTNKIGYEMKKLCQTGYFTREKIKQGKSVYKYIPTERFNMIQREVYGG